VSSLENIVAPWLAGESLAVVTPWTAPARWLELARAGDLGLRLVVERDWAAFLLGGGLGLPVLHLGLTEGAARALAAERHSVTSWECLGSSLIGPIAALAAPGMRWVELHADRGVPAHPAYRRRCRPAGAWLGTFTDPRLAPQGAPVLEGQDGASHVDADWKRLFSRLPAGARTVHVTRVAAAGAAQEAGLVSRTLDLSQRDARLDARLQEAGARAEGGVDVVLHAGENTVAFGGLCAVEAAGLDPSDLAQGLDLWVGGASDGHSIPDVDPARLLERAESGTWRGRFGVAGATALEDLLDLGVLARLRAGPALARVADASGWTADGVAGHPAALDVVRRLQEAAEKLHPKEQQSLGWTDAHGRDLVAMGRVLGLGAPELADVVRSLDAEGRITATLVERAPGGERSWELARALSPDDVAELRRRIGWRREREAEARALLQSPGCRRVGVRQVMGLPEGIACGRCDRCETGPQEGSARSGGKRAPQANDPRRRWARALEQVERRVRRALSHGEAPLDWDQPIREELSQADLGDWSVAVAAALAHDLGAFQEALAATTLPGHALIAHLISLSTAAYGVLVDAARAELDAVGPHARAEDRPLAARFAVGALAWVDPPPALSARDLGRWLSRNKNVSLGVGERLIAAADGGGAGDWSLLHDSAPERLRAAIRARARVLGRTDRHLFLAEVRALAGQGEVDSALGLLPSAFAHADDPLPLWWMLFGDLPPERHDELLAHAAERGVLPPGLASALIAERDASREGRRVVLAAASSGDARATLVAWVARHPFAGPRALGPTGVEEMALRSTEAAIREAQLQRILSVLVACRTLPPDPRAADAEMAAWAALRDAETSGTGSALRAALRKLCRRAPQDPWPMLWLARSSGLHRWSAEAERCFEEAIALIPSQRLAGEAREDAAAAARAAGRTEWAEKLVAAGVEPVVTKAPEPPPARGGGGQRP
jgi:predicted nucleic acid-binding protein